MTFGDAQLTMYTDDDLLFPKPYRDSQLHSHNTNEIYYVLGGKIIIHLAEGVNVELQQGDAADALCVRPKKAKKTVCCRNLKIQKHKINRLWHDSCEKM